MADQSDCLDHEICKQMSSLVELLTTSGKPTLNVDIMKKFKKLCRTSDMYVEHAFHLLMSQLTVGHSEVRLSSFLMVEELFTRSHAFRELLVTDFQSFLELTVGIDADRPLPAPKYSAQTLKAEAYKTIQKWYEVYGEAYKKLTLGYHFLKNCKKVDFDGIQARNAAEVRQREETERKLAENRKHKLDKVLGELNELSADIGLCVTEIENGIQLLLPTPDDFFINISEPSHMQGTNPVKDTSSELRTSAKSCVTDSAMGTTSNHVSHDTITNSAIDITSSLNSINSGISHYSKNPIPTSTASMPQSSAVTNTSNQDDKIYNEDISNDSDETGKEISENSKEDSMEQCSCGRNKNDKEKTEQSCTECDNKGVKRTASTLDSDTVKSSKKIKSKHKGERTVVEDTKESFDKEENSATLEVGELVQEEISVDVKTKTAENKSESGNLKLDTNSQKDSNGIIDNDKDTKNEGSDHNKSESGTKEETSNNDNECNDEQCTAVSNSTAYNENDIDSETTDEDNNDDESDDFEDVEGAEGYTQEHGMFSHKFSMTIQVDNKTKFQVTEDNKDLIQDVRERYKLVKNKYLPHVKKWMQVMSKCGANQEHVKSALDLKTKLEEAVKKCIELEIVTSTDKPGKDSDSDDEFEEVPDKEGYEADIPEHVKLEAARSAAASGSKTKGGRGMRGRRKQSKTSTIPSQTGKATSSHWTLSERLADEGATDPTSWKSNIQKIQQKSSTTARKSSCTSTVTSSSTYNQIKQEPGTSSAGPSTDTRKQSLLNKAPVLSFGLDLEHWGQSLDKVKAPVRENKYDEVSRFWVAQDDKDVDSTTSQEVAALTRRTFTYTGEFEPVQWTCRAPLPEGQLCERMDRVKCPFHGRVIGRDKLGFPTNPADTERLAREKAIKDETEVVQDWKDPELLADIEAATGHDLGSTKVKGKGKGKGKKKNEKQYPNLTDIKEAKNTCRNRLEKKIFKKSTLKRVNNVLDTAQMKMISDKFGHNFNYSLK